PMGFLFEALGIGEHAGDASVDPESLEGRRVALMKAEIFDSIDEAARKWRQENADVHTGANTGRGT
ncbi:MAG: hypothetical protein IKJ45_06090, partial [Kiritimatiellae bacterium]|nr:hypothetical protein [Kiritimatiellia bacterium]